MQKNKDLSRFLPFTIVAIFSSLLTVLAAINPAFWSDEAYSIASARLSWTGLIEWYLHFDVHPPLFFLLLKSGFSLFGESVLVAKLVAAFPAIITVFFTTIFIQKEFSVRAACFFAICSAASTSIVLFGIEIRPYSLALLFVTSAFISIWYIAKNGKTIFYFALIICMLGAALSHYYAILAVGYLFLFLLAYCIKYDRKKLKKTIISGIAAIVLFLPWGIPFISGFSSLVGNISQSVWNPVDILKYVYNTFTVGISPNVVSRIATVCNMAVFFFVFYSYLKSGNKSKNDFLIAGGALCIVFVAAVGILLCIFVRPMFFGRYLFPSNALVWVFFAVAAAQLHRKREKYFLQVCIPIFSLLTVFFCFQKENKEKKGFEKYYSEIIQHIDKDDVMVYPDGLGAYHIAVINAILLPGHTNIISEYTAGPFSNETFWKLYKSQWIDYASLTATPFPNGQSLWIFTTAGQEKIPLLEDAEFLGRINYDFYEFDVYLKKF